FAVQAEHGSTGEITFGGLRSASAPSSSKAVRNSATARVWRSGADQSISPGALPCFDDACINRKALALHKACVHAGTDHRAEHLAQDVAIAKPAVAINRERRMIGNLVIELEAAEPTITEMKFDLFAQLPFKADAVAVADNEHPDHQLRIDRGPPDV